MKKPANRKILFNFCMCLMACAVLSSCDYFKEKNIIRLPVQLTEGGAWVFINEKGERIGNQEWEFEPTISQNGLFTAREGDGLTVYQWDKDVAKPIDSLQNLVSVGIYSDGLLPVTPQMQRIKIVDKKGKVKFVLEPIDGKEVMSCSAKFCEGLLIVTTSEGKAGVIDTEGKVIVKPKYNEISDFNEGYALAAIYPDDYEEGPSYYIINKEGKASQVKGEFGYEEGECSSVPQFVNGVVYVPGKPDGEGEDFTYKTLKITTDGKVTEEENNQWVSPVEGGGEIITSYGEKSSSKWVGPEDKTIMEISDDGGWLSATGRWVTLRKDDVLTLYNNKGETINTFSGNYYPYWSEGDFGLVLSGSGEESGGETIYKLLDAEGKPINGAEYYGVSTRTTVDLNGYDDEVGCDDATVTSAYVDVTAAASKLATMISDGIKGKSYYYLGQKVADILSGNNARYFSGNSRTFSIPTDSTSWNLASGAGFWISGTGHASADIVAPTYQQYFEVHHYDRYGRAWGWNRSRQVGVHFNQNAKVDYFDLQLHTNHPSGTRLREALGRRLKKEGYTVIQEAPNYDEFSNGYRNVLVYGSAESDGIGAIIYDKSTYFYKSDEEKAALTTQL